MNNPGGHVPQNAPQHPTVGSQRSLRWSRAEWKAAIAGKRVEIIFAAINLVVVTLLLGMLVPYKMDQNALELENRGRCWQSVLEVRRSLDAVQDGFMVQPSSPIPRRSDLRGAQLTLKNAGHACDGVFELSDVHLETDAFVSRAEALIARSDAGGFLTYSNFDETGFIREVSDWTDDSLEELEK